MDDSTVMPSPALDGQDFSHDDDFANEMGTWPAFSPPFGDAEVGSTSPVSTHVYAGWTAPSESLAGRSYWVNTEILQHHNDASLDSVVSPGCFSGTQDLFNVSAFGVQEQMMLVGHDAEGIDGITVFHGHPMQSLDSQFDIGGLSAQSIPLSCAASDPINPSQWPLGDQFLGQNPASDFIGNLNHQTLLDSDIPILCN